MGGRAVAVQLPGAQSRCQQSIVESAGRALTEGVANLLGDVKKGRITQTDESQFEIGRNVAVTPGEVVFENRLIQLIQYAP